MSGNLRARHQDTLTVIVATAKSRPVSGAQVRADLTHVGISGIKKTKTDSHGRARMTFTPRKQGTISIRASKRGYRTKTVTARVHA
jgi:hypothetical protein